MNAKGRSDIVGSHYAEAKCHEIGIKRHIVKEPHATPVDGEWFIDLPQRGRMDQNIRWFADQIDDTADHRLEKKSGIDRIQIARIIIRVHRAADAPFEGSAEPEP